MSFASKTRCACTFDKMVPRNDLWLDHSDDAYAVEVLCLKKARKLAELGETRRPSEPQAPIQAEEARILASASLGLLSRWPFGASPRRPDCMKGRIFSCMLVRRETIRRGGARREEHSHQHDVPTGPMEAPPGDNIDR